jgi:hypothetical protein
MTDDLGAVVGVYRRNPLKTVQFVFTALGAFGLGGACIWAIYEMKPKSTGLPWLFVMACAMGGAATIWEIVQGRDLLLEMCERGFRFRRGGRTVAARWADVRSVSTWRRAGEPLWHTLVLASGQKVRLGSAFERFSELEPILSRILGPS